MATQEERLQKLERKALEADARLRKAKREVEEEKRKVRTRCNIIIGAAMMKAMREEDSEMSEEILRIVEKYTSQRDLKYLNDNTDDIW